MKYKKKNWPKLMLKFFDIEPYGSETVITDQGPKTILKPCDFPMMAGFCRKYRISRQTLYRWVKEHEELREAYRIAKLCQEDILTTNSLLKLYDKTFAIFCAKNVLKWRDVHSHEVSGPDEGPIQTEDVTKLSDEELNDRIKKHLLN